MPTEVAALKNEKPHPQTSAQLEAGEIGRIIDVQVEGSGYTDVAADEISVAADLHTGDLSIDIEPAVGLDVQGHAGRRQTNGQILPFGKVKRGRNKRTVEQKALCGNS